MVHRRSIPATWTFLAMHANMTCLFTFNPSPFLSPHKWILVSLFSRADIAYLTPRLSMGSNHHERREKQGEVIYWREKRKDEHLQLEWTYCGAPLNKFRDPTNTFLKFMGLRESLRVFGAFNPFKILFGMALFTSKVIFYSFPWTTPSI